MTDRVIIIGNGVAGITAARHVRKRSDREIVVISGETDHFFSRTALMYIYMGHMKYEHTKPYADSFWAENRIELRRAWVAAIDTGRRAVTLDGGEEIEYGALLIATGSRSNRFGWPGQDLAGVQGLYGVQDLESMERDTAHIRRGMVVGGGLIGVETAEMLHSRGIPATFLVRESRWMEFAYPPEESALIEAEIRRHGIDLRCGTELARIEPDDAGRVRAVVTADGDEIPCEFVALTVGVSPNADLARAAGIECDRGVLVDAHLCTSVPGVYAAGDCAQLRDVQPGRKATEAVWYVGRAMGQTVARTICGEPTPYDPGIWFNSAKFFGLEWQVYGHVPAAPPDGIESLYWQHAKEPRAIRVHFRRTDGAVTGFQVLGVRYRHDTCHRWIADGADIRLVLENLGAANFDPELFVQHENGLVEEYNRRFPERPVRLRRRRGLFGRRTRSA